MRPTRRFTSWPSWPRTTAPTPIRILPIASPASRCAGPGKPISLSASLPLRLPSPRSSHRRGWTALDRAHERHRQAWAQNLSQLFRPNTQAPLGPGRGSMRHAGIILGAPHVLQVPTDTADWQGVDTTIAAAARQLLAAEDTFDRRIAIFPLAPVSACISLGYHLTSRPHLRLFQHHRDERSWVWPRRLAPAQDIVVAGLDGKPHHDRAATFVFHYSATITDDVLIEAAAPLELRVDFRVPESSTGWLRHPDQLTWAALEARRAFERAMQLAPNAAEWHLFYAGPAPLAVAIGQQINPTMYPAIQLYEYRYKESPRYKPSIRLGA